MKSCCLTSNPAAGEITFLGAVVNKEIRPKRNGGSYLSLRLADRSAELAQRSGTAPKLSRNCFRRLMSCLHPVEIRKRMFGELQAFVAMIRNDALRQLIDSIVNDAAISGRLRTAPAALKIHHAFRAGLLEHIVSLCSLAVALTAHYQRLNLDWLIAGAVLHDLGKIDTLTSTGVRFDYTTRGQLIEHVTLGLEILDRHVSRLPAFPLELKTVLQHLIVSHHGDLDKGALRRPMLPEALALSILDLLDARMEQVFRTIDSSPDREEFTPYVPSLERQLFRGFAAASAERIATGGTAS